MNWKVKGGKFVNGDKTMNFVDAIAIWYLARKHLDKPRIGKWKRRK